MNKILCYIFSTGDRYKSLAKCAGSSFKKWHSNIDTKWEHFTALSTEPVLGLAKLKYAYKSTLEGNYDKVIILGADTITCSYLDEFINNKEDVLCTLDYPYTLRTPHVTTPPGDYHVNADVVCFNNINALKDTIKLTETCPTNYYEQGALNQLLYNFNNQYTYKIIDGPYKESSVIYNARAKGNIAANPGEKPWSKYTLKMYVKDDKLMSFDNKQIKVWHYCEGLGTLDNSKFEEQVNHWIFDWFNDETRHFFTESCACGDFFKGGRFIHE